MNKEKEFIIIVQCHIVMERCSGYFCEKSFHDRTGGFEGYPADKSLRSLYLTCGGCCGRAVHRKLYHLMKMIHKKEGVEKDKIEVRLASCITKDNFHALPCPHLDYMETLIIEKLGLDLKKGTTVNKLSKKRREEGIYKS